MSIFTEIEARELHCQREREIEQGIKIWNMLHQKRAAELGLQVKLLLNASEWMISIGSRLKKRAEKLSLQSNKSMASFSKGSC